MSKKGLNPLHLFSTLPPQNIFFLLNKKSTTFYRFDERIICALCNFLINLHEVEGRGS